MNPENQRASRIIVGSILIGAAILFTAMMIALMSSLEDLEISKKGMIIVFVAFIDVAFLIIGIRSIIIGANSYKVMKQGRIKEAKVISITRVNGSARAVELVVSFYGESGKQYELTVYTHWAHVMNVVAGQYIQCYVNGETGYIDTYNIKVVREKEEEINFE